LRIAIYQIAILFKLKALTGNPLVRAFLFLINFMLLEVKQYQ